MSSNDSYYFACFEYLNGTLVQATFYINYFVGKCFRLFRIKTKTKFDIWFAILFYFKEIPTLVLSYNRITASISRNITFGNNTQLNLICSSINSKPSVSVDIYNPSTNISFQLATSSSISPNPLQICTNDLCTTILRGMIKKMTSLFDLIQTFIFTIIYFKLHLTLVMLPSIKLNK